MERGKSFFDRSFPLKHPTDQGGLSDSTSVVRLL
jgi:hypothetical protein